MRLGRPWNFHVSAGLRDVFPLNSPEGRSHFQATLQASMSGHGDAQKAMQRALIWAYAAGRRWGLRMVETPPPSFGTVDGQKWGRIGYNYSGVLWWWNRGGRMTTHDERLDRETWWWMLWTIGRILFSDKTIDLNDLMVILQPGTSIQEPGGILNLPTKRDAEINLEILK